MRKKYARRKTKEKQALTICAFVVHIQNTTVTFLKNKPEKKGEQCLTASVKNLRNKTQLARWLADERKDCFATKM